MRAGGVSANSIRAEGYRLTAEYHLSEDQVAVAQLARFSACEPLWELCNGRHIFRGPIFTRRYTEDPRLGEPYVSGSDLLQADVRPVSFLSRTHGALLDDLRLQSGMILITCSGMNLGDVIWTRDDLAGLVATHDLIRVVADSSKVPPGYLYIFLLSRYGHAFIRKQIYGGNIKHIEPDHLKQMPVPRLQKHLEDEIHELAMESARQRSEFVAGIREATDHLFAALGLADLPVGAPAEGRSFAVASSELRTLRALNHDPVVAASLDAIRATGSVRLGDICSDGKLSTGARFKRVDTDPGVGVRLIGQKHGFWMRPHGRWINAAMAPRSVFATDETVLVASSGTLGKRELYCRPILATGRWLDFVYTQHFLRVVTGDAEFPGAFLFAFLRSEVAFRALRSMSTGTKQQEIHRELVADLPIPAPPADVRAAVAARVRDAHRVRDEADVLEERALTMLERAVEAAT